MGEVPGPKRQGCARLAACPLKLTSFLWQILIIILVPDNHSFTHTTTLGVPYCGRGWQFTIMHINFSGEMGGKYTKFTSTWKLGNLEFGWRDKKKPKSSVLCILFPYMHNRSAKNLIFKKQTKKLVKHERMKISIRAPVFTLSLGLLSPPNPSFNLKLVISTK